MGSTIIQSLVVENPVTANNLIKSKLVVNTVTSTQLPPAFQSPQLGLSFIPGLVFTFLT